MGTGCSLPNHPWVQRYLHSSVFARQHGNAASLLQLSGEIPDAARGLERRSHAVVFWLFNHLYLPGAGVEIRSASRRQSLGVSRIRVEYLFSASPAQFRESPSVRPGATRLHHAGAGGLACILRQSPRAIFRLLKSKGTRRVWGCGLSWRPRFFSSRVFLLVTWNTARSTMKALFRAANTWTRCSRPSKPQC